jgi:hypothetical protein
VPGTTRLKDQVAVMMLTGASLGRVETDLIDPAPVNANQKAALWLFARSFVDLGEQRAEASRYLALLGD